MKHNSKILIAVLAGILLLGACKKASTTVYTTANPKAEQHNQDMSNTKSESDNVNTDVNNAVLGNTTFGKNSSVQAVSICGGTIDTSGMCVTSSFTINFDSTTLCANRIRSGSIKVALVTGTHWSTAGSQLLLTYTNYKVTFPSLSNHFICFNGTKLLTDVSGIDYIHYYTSGGSLTATVRERSYNMLVTFENNAIAHWNDARLETWSVTGYTNFSATANGDTTIGPKTIDSWGQTRYGTTFTNQMVQPWQSGTTCGWWHPTSGNYTCVSDSFTVSALLGVDNSGNQVTSGCAYGLKLSWTLTPSNITGQAIVAYW